MKKIVIAFLLCNLSAGVFAQQHSTENIVIVTLDGMRWQEVFGGADSILLRNHKYTRDSNGTSSRFWQNDINERRKLLFPFLWTVVAKKGQIHGNRNFDSKVNKACACGTSPNMDVRL